jgi:hypothetical protein
MGSGSPLAPRTLPVRWVPAPVCTGMSRTAARKTTRGRMMASYSNVSSPKTVGNVLKMSSTVKPFLLGQCVFWGDPLAASRKEAAWLSSGAGAGRSGVSTMLGLLWLGLGRERPCRTCSGPGACPGQEEGGGLGLAPGQAAGRKESVLAIGKERTEAGLAPVSGERAAWRGSVAYWGCDNPDGVKWKSVRAMRPSPFSFPCSLLP